MTYESFVELSKSYNVIPISKTILADLLTPVSAYLRIRKNSQNSFLFESVQGGENVARYSFIGKEPVVLIKGFGDTTMIHNRRESRQSDKSIFEICHELLVPFRSPILDNLPRFTCGLVGFLGYDAVRSIENIPLNHPPAPDVPDSILGMYRSVIAFDHFRHHITIITNVFVDGDAHLREQYENAIREIASIESQLMDERSEKEPFRTDSRRIHHSLTKDEFLEAVSRAKEYIRAGDAFQIVLSQRLSTDYTGDLFNIYRSLRCINPSPYLYFLDFDEVKVIGSSPEILVRMQQGIAEVYPIAGTRRRGITEEEDQILEQDLLTDPKERAEHIMLVDLGRNDLGRVCEAKSVRVDQLMTPVRYSHVMHLASRISGLVKPGLNCIDVFKATFPAGTVTGAPKIRAMEIIEELEPVRRGIYAGGVGYFDFSGNMDFCITIRTLYAVNGKLFAQAGAGIVADSDPEREYQETINKCQALLDAISMAESISS